MHFRVEQPLAVPREVAVRALVDPGFYASMGAMDNIGTPEILRREERDGAVHLAVRYRFTGHLARPARAVLDPAKLSWVIESAMFVEETRAEFRMLPDNYADRLECAGTYVFEDRGDTSAQLVEGELRIHLPLVAGAAERGIFLGLRQHMADEAALLARWAESRP
jgi:hypothetical protein